MEPLSIRACLRYGWETFKKRPWYLAGITFLILFITVIVPSGKHGQPWMYYGAFFILGNLVKLFVQLGAMHFAIRVHDAPETAHLRDLWVPERYLRFLGTSLLVLVIVIVGFVLFIVPGVIAAVGLSFATYLVVDKGLAPVAALKESWRMTKGNRWNLIGLFFLSGLLNIVGALFLLVGLLVTLPITSIAMVHAYRTIGKPEPSPAPTPVTT